MGKLFEDRGLLMYLYDRSQHHGHHNYSHIHVKWKDGTTAVYSILGELIEGSNKDFRLISNFIKINRNEINYRLSLLAAGKSIKPIKMKIYK